MDQLSAWAPTIVTVITAIFILGGGWNKLTVLEKRVDEHDKLHAETEKHDTEQDIALAKIEAFNEGLKVGRSESIPHQSRS